MTHPTPERARTAIRRVNLDDFMATVLPEVAKRHEFTLDEQGSIRAKNPLFKEPGPEPLDLCPLTAACFDDPDYGHLVFNTGQMMAAGGLIGLSYEACRQITAAADHRPYVLDDDHEDYPYYDADVRAALLAALGLTDPEEEDE